jgi:hypothetical protein
LLDPFLGFFALKGALSMIRLNDIAPSALSVVRAALVVVVMATTATAAQTPADHDPACSAPETSITEPADILAVAVSATSAQVHPWIPSGGTPGAPARAMPDNDDEGWQFSLAPYGFLSSVNGQIRAGDVSVDVDRSFGDIADVLKFAAGIRIEAQHEKFGFAFDNNYVKLGDDITTDRLIAPDFRFELTLNVTEIEPSYRLWSSGDQDDPVGGPEIAVDVIGGVRLVHFETDLLVRRLIAADDRRTGSSTYVHGYIGNRFIWSPSKYVSFESRYNIALASDFSWFVNAGLDIRPWEHFSIGGGLQVLDLSLENDSADTALDARLAGPVLFMKFHF